VIKVQSGKTFEVAAPTETTSGLPLSGDEEREVESGEQVSFGYIPPVPVTLYEDINQNEKQDDDEPGLFNVTITIGMTDYRTDVNGQISVPVPAGESVDVPVPSAIPGKMLVLFSPKSPQSIQVGGELSFGYVTKVTVTLYVDSNGNGIQDKGEPGIPNERKEIDGVVYITDANGQFVIKVQSGKTFEVAAPTETTSGLPLSGDEEREVESGEQVSFGYIPPVPVTLYEDINQNEKQDDDEPGLFNVTITIGMTDYRTDVNGQISVPVPAGESVDVPVPSAIPGKMLVLFSPKSPQSIQVGGELSFGYVPGAIVTLYEDLDGSKSQDINESGIPEIVVEIGDIDYTTDADGKIFVPTPSEDNVNVPSAIPSESLMLDSPSLPQILNVGDDLSFGYVPYGTLGINIFQDLNGNAEDDGNEPLVNFVEVEVTIYKDGIFFQKRTVSSGKDSLLLPPGKYQVFANDSNIEQLGYERTTESDTINVTVLAGGNITAEYGFRADPTGAVSVKVYFDRNKNKVFEATDPLLENVRVILEANDGLMTIEGKTDSNGVVTFENLPILDTYKISIDEETTEFNVRSEDTLPSGTFKVEPNTTTAFVTGFQTSKVSNDNKDEGGNDTLVVPVGFPF